MTMSELNASFEKQKKDLQQSLADGKIDKDEFSRRMMKLANLRSIAVAGLRRTQALQEERKKRDAVLASFKRASVEDQL
jgi:hypothetical protein